MFTRPLLLYGEAIAVVNVNVAILATFWNKFEDCDLCTVIDD
jgi:hypothetical protein